MVIMPNSKTKKTYQKRAIAKLAAHEQFLLAHLAKDWEQTQKQAKREAIVRKIDDAAGMLARDVLKLAAIGGILLAGPIGASMIGIAVTGGSRQRAFCRKESFDRSRYYLAEEGYVQSTKKDGGVFEFTLTEKGRRRVLRDVFRDFQLEKPGKWDGYWRVVIFDITERRKWARDGFREKLRGMDFYPFQESALITPYPCDKELAFLMDVFEVGHCVHILKVQHMTNDVKLRRFFGL